MMCAGGDVRDGMVEVFVAMIAFAPTVASRSATTVRLTDSSSNTASMTKSARGKPEKSAVPERSADSRSYSCFVIRRRVSRPSRIPTDALSPFPTRARSASFSRTSTPAWATAVPAMPDPMKPEPTTPSRRTGRAWRTEATPSSF
jgi:hypothetical protein